MRAASVLIAVLLVAGSARADDALGVGAAVGAGGQGTATYGAIELRLDAQWHGARVGLGGRGVWLDGHFRTDDWNRAADAITVLRLLEVHTPGRTASLAAGGLAPIQIAQLAEGYRTALDDRARTGARAGVATRPFSADLVIDDVLDPAVTGGAIAWRATDAWSVRAGALVDPGVGEAATEGAIARTWQREHARAEAGGGLVYEPGFGAAAVAFAGIERERGTARITAGADLRAGSGSVGGAFGPLYRLERAQLWSHAEAGLGAGMQASIAAPIGWVGASVRARPGNGVIAAVSAGAPLGRWMQTAAWAAATSRAAAGAGELRVAWARAFSSALQIARMYDADAMEPAPIWSITAWFAMTSH